MPIILKSNKQREVINPIKVAYYRAEDSDSEKAAMNAWNMMLSLGKKQQFKFKKP